MKAALLLFTLWPKMEWLLPCSILISEDHISLSHWYLKQYATANSAFLSEHASNSYYINIFKLFQYKMSQQCISFNLTSIDLTLPVIQTIILEFIFKCIMSTQKEENHCFVLFFSFRDDKLKRTVFLKTLQRNLTISLCMFIELALCLLHVLRCVFPVLGQKCLPDLSLTLTMCPQHKQPVTPFI